MSHMTGLFCLNCGKKVLESEFMLKCPSCNGVLEAQYDLENMKKSLLSRSPKKKTGSFLEQWLDILPINNPHLIDNVSLGEQETPLVRSNSIGRSLGIDNLFFKLEFMAPTVSLKDRGTSLCALKALELGFDTLCIPSSGNNAASTAAYAAKAGLKAVVFIQKDVSPLKISKIMAYGAKIVRIDGNLSEARKICEELTETHRWFNCSSLNPYRPSAKRTVAYEIVDQLEGRSPDAMFFPIGGGAGIVSAYKGFLEMQDMGITSAMPRLIGAQLEACDPITQAFKQGLDELPLIQTKPTLSDALTNKNPFLGVYALEAIRKTHGQAVSISDQEFLQTIESLGSKEGLFVEPAGAVSVAALVKLKSQKKLDDLKTIVCTLTGYGLNLPQTIPYEDKIPHPIKPDISAVEAFLKQG